MDAAVLRDAGHDKQQGHGGKARYHQENGSKPPQRNDQPRTNWPGEVADSLNPAECGDRFTPLGNVDRLADVREPPEEPGGHRCPNTSAANPSDPAEVAIAAKRQAVIISAAPASMVTLSPSRDAE